MAGSMAFLIPRLHWLVFIICQLMATAALSQSAEPAQNPATGSEHQEQPGTQQLHWIAYVGDEAQVRRLVEGGADVNARVENGNTPLHMAAYNGHIGVSKYLVEQGAQLNARTNKGITPLDWARRNGHEQLAQLLIANGAEAGQGLPAGTASTRASIPASIPAQKTQKTAVTAKAVRLAVQNPVQAGAYRIQLGSFSSEQAAIDAWAMFRRRHPEILGESRLIRDIVSVNGKQHYRVQSAASGEQEARSLCEQLKSQGQSCFVVAPQAPRGG